MTSIPPSILKRPRTPPPSGPASSSSDHPTPKAIRTALPPLPASSSTTHQVICTLPPTCNPPVHKPTPLANTQELERHYATYHAHHQTECHDPIAGVRKDRGDKIFACHLPTCPRLFLTPKGRRLHLIQAHGYPKEYFFAVTNKGVGGLLRKWGEGVSLVRGVWRERERAGDGGEAGDGDGDGGSEESEEEDENENENATRGKNGLRVHTPLVEDDSSESDSESPETDQKKKASDTSIDSIASAMTSLSLVPPAIRFGRGAKRGGYTSTTTPEPVEHMEIDGVHGGRGRGNGRARGRGRGAHVPARGLGGGRGGRSGFPRGGRAIGRGVGRGF
ncbi:hypothetical protein EIP91_010331 [Steccherinum ochraceum]|uniref:C2H2-type domain-containing protein n=1 Tax=Steccherinum ochraceum TaxID=92696 RepID=A0A4V2MV59_9APHY|nr:hypothetical protein EIP91_010331 [Steccherinum ochraceum]